VLLRAAVTQCSAAFLWGATMTIVGSSASQPTEFVVRGADGEMLFSGSSAEEAVAFALDAQYKARMRDFVTKLELVPHPEGGFFREIYRSGAPPMASRGRTDAAGEVMATPLGDRNQLTSMFWMANTNAPVLKMGVNVSMHIHYYNGGAPFRYYLIGADKVVKQVVLGPDPSLGHEQQMVVPSDTYKFGVLERPAAAFAKDTTRFVLVSEAVCPGFDFGDFNWVTADMLRSRVQGDEDLNAFSVFLYDAPGDRGFDRFYAVTTTTMTTTTDKPAAKPAPAAADVLAGLVDPFILDVRDPNEVSAGKGGPPKALPGSVNVPLNHDGVPQSERLTTLDEFLVKLGEAGATLPTALDHTIITHCGSGGRGRKCMKLLQQLGYTQVYNGGSPAHIATARGLLD